MLPDIPPGALACGPLLLNVQARSRTRNCSAQVSADSRRRADTAGRPGEMDGDVFLDKTFEKLKDDDIIVSRDWSHHQYIMRFDETYPEELKDYGVRAEVSRDSSRC